MRLWKGGKPIDYPEGTIAFGSVYNGYRDEQNTTPLTHLIAEEKEFGNGFLYGYGVLGPKTLIDQQSMRLRTPDRIGVATIKVTITLPDGATADEFKFRIAPMTTETWRHEAGQLGNNGQFCNFTYTQLLNPNYEDRRKPEDRDIARVLTVRNDSDEAARNMAKHWLHDIDSRTHLALDPSWADKLYEIETINGHINPLLTIGFVGVVTSLNDEQMQTNIERLYGMEKLPRPMGKRKELTTNG